MLKLLRALERILCQDNNNIWNDRNEMYVDTFLHVQYTAQFSCGSSRHIDTSLTLASFFTMHVITICQKVRVYYSCPKMLIAKRKSCNSDSTSTACHNWTPNPLFSSYTLFPFQLETCSLQYRTVAVHHFSKPNKDKVLHSVTQSSIRASIYN